MSIKHEMMLKELTERVEALERSSDVINSLVSQISALSTNLNLRLAALSEMLREDQIGREEWSLTKTC